MLESGHKPKADCGHDNTDHHVQYAPGRRLSKDRLQQPGAITQPEEPDERQDAEDDRDDPDDRLALTPADEDPDAPGHEEERDEDARIHSGERS